MRDPRSFRDLAWQTGLDYVYATSARVGNLLSGSVPDALAAGTRTPVLLIPGVYEPWRFLLPIGRRLSALGHPVHVLPQLGYNLAPIPDTAATAQRYLDDHGLEHVVIVGHSKGGLVGKHMMTIDDVAGRIDRLVAIASPFSGSTRAKYVPVRTIRPFIPGSELLSSLSANLEINSRITSIYPETDQVIPNGSFLEGAANVTLPLVGHFRILSNPAVVDAVVFALRPGVE
jgi:pimeloyl-ACP methyl ester carboxylesterase